MRGKGGGSCVRLADPVRGLVWRGWLTRSATLTAMHSLRRWWSGQRTVSFVASSDAPLRPMMFWPVVTLVVVVVLAGGAAGMVLLGVWDESMAATDAEQMRLDRIKTGLTVAAGLAAGVTLLMALRRQSLSERAQRFAETEALEQRTTTLYVAAAEQLGSEKAAVRLAGLYALERLGQDNPKLRQTVFDVWCAYLRMPYTPPAEVLGHNVESSPSRSAADTTPLEPREETDRRQELQVRLTAQRLLAAHLRIDGDGTPEDGYWLTERGLRLSVDLTGAQLTHFVLEQCMLGGASFIEVQFHGGVYLSKAQFHGPVYLGGAQSHGGANLSEAQFYSTVSMGGAQFHGGANLTGTQFYNHASLSEAQFHGDAYLSGTQFYEDADLTGTQFHGNTFLGGSQFHRNARLTGTQFHGNAYLSNSTRLNVVFASELSKLPDGWVRSIAANGEGSSRAVIPPGQESMQVGSEPASVAAADLAR